jgi:glycosyltransferase involved in cell wall biosynthesis
MKPKVALVYDRANTTYGGAEKVLLALHQAFPQAPLYTSLHHHDARWAKNFDVKTSFLQKIPFANKLHRFFVLLMPLAFESFNLSEYDIVVSITSAEAKGVITRPNQLHVCYLLTPSRYLYSHRTHYEQTHWPFKIPIINFFSKKIFDYLSWWDQAAAFRPDVIIPISNLIKDRAKQYYHRNTEKIIYPPLDLNQLRPVENHEAYSPYYLPDKYYLVIARLVPYKRIELAIQACQRLNRNLVIIGEGPSQKKLEKIANESTYFLGNVTSIQRQAILSQAQALLMPGIEDFGITALEAILSDKPVVLHKMTGAAELFKDEKVAIYLDKLSTKAVEKAILQLEQTEFSFSLIKKKLTKYAINDFIGRFKKTVFDFYDKKQEELS